KIDIIIAVSDYRHLYSGMIYPPAIGSVEAVTGMLEARLALRAAVLAVALLIGVSALLIGLLSGRRVLLALYGLLCLLFAGYACYPVVMTLGRGSPLFYAMESAAFCAILLVVIALQNKLYQGGGRTLRHIMYGFGGAVCLLALAMPLFRASMPVINAYSNLVEAYHWITSGYITVTAGLAVWKRARDITPVFWGMLVLDCTLVMDRVLSHFEPVLSGWFPEFGCFALVLSVGAAVARDIIRGYREKAVLEEQVRVIISAGSDHYRKMDALHEKLRILHHDVKYHLAAVGELAASGDNDGIGRYLSGVQARLSENGMRDYCSNNVINALLSSYAERCAQAGIRYGVEASLPEKLTIPDYDLCIVVGNLLENAVEACGRLTGGQYIDLWLKPLGEQLALIVRNSFDGRLAGKKSGGGLGLKSVDAVAAMYDGELTTEWDGESFTAGVTVRL
ncbi:MAG: GHKL domain-containing protein, partial [Oscillospiraceae bacterium]|nr:GHKL domain-containing protein [Oscillospiraceae bacterium]